MGWIDAPLDTIAAFAEVRPSGAYWVRQLSPGWPPAFHKKPSPDIETVQMSLERIETIGGLLALAIVLLVSVTILISRKGKPSRSPWRR